MKLGVIFPQTEMGSRPEDAKKYAEAADSLGYNHLTVYDHVLGADMSYHSNLVGAAYTLEDQFYEPLVLFGYLAAVTKRIQLTTGIIILPQRQTALVAKQAATIDLLTGGRLRLGIGIGWNYVEYEALGERFSDRGRRSEEQVALLRQLWTEDKVNFEGEWNRVTHAGIRPMPIQQPIPIWFGGSSDRVLKRIGRLGDGWIASGRDTSLDNEFRRKIQVIHRHAEMAGRNPRNIGIEGFVDADRPVKELVQAAKKWESFGATHVSLQTMNCGFATVDQHIQIITKFKEAFG
ncbi:MAG: LLM class F420-dependent oxidoreductase [Dehalococcoidia bacterium]|nr:LLM class F420-dependent oxidoreductase [Dehalococcoidia bacterium]